MKKTILAKYLALALVAGLTSFAGSAKATLTFDWSFNSSYTFGSGFGSAGDLVTGTITGTVGAGGAFTPSVLTATAGTTLLNLNDMSNLVENTLSVSGNKLTGSINYWTPGPSIGLSVDMGFGFESWVASNNDNGAGYHGSVLFTSESNGDTAAVPEPTTYALFGLGALALVIAYRRKVA